MPATTASRSSTARPDFVPHYLFGKQPFAREFAKKYNLPLAASLMGAASMYPELAAQLRTRERRRAVLARAGPAVGDEQGGRSEPRDGQVHVLPIRNNVYMLVGDGGNIVVQTGEQGPFVVDTGEGKLSDKVLAAIRTLTPKPIQFIANTSFHAEHTGGNAALGDAGQDPSLPGSFFVQSAPRGVTGFFADPLSHATMIGHNNVMVRMQAAGAPARRDSGRHLSRGSAAQVSQRRRDRVLPQPNASTDGDSLVHFRCADVIVAGDIFTTTQYPFIDAKNGGTVQGLIRALNASSNLTVFRHQGEGGTYVVPGHGYLSDEHEVVEYRDMVVIVRDRVKAMKDGGATLAQIQAARVTADYDTRYGANTGPWTTAMFVQAIYDTLSVQPSPR